MKVRSYGALMGALLTISSVEAAEAATCPCAPVPPPPPKHAAVTKAPPPATHAAKDNGLSYAQSYYNYRSASRVTEQFVRNAPVPRPQPAPVARPMAQDDGWRVAPNDAHIHFYRDEREVIVPGAFYPQSYYAPPNAYAPMAYASPPPGYAYPPPAYPYPPADAGIDLDAKDFNGGVGAQAMMGGGGGGGTAFIVNNGGASDEPPNGGGENIPAGYGPTYRGVWQGPVNPTAGGLPTSSSSSGSH